MSRLTPLHIDLILHAYTTIGPYPHGESTAAKELYIQLQADEILWFNPEPQQYEVTRKGEIFIDMILNTPYPVLQYVDPRVPLS